jgi:hypothetical protein
MELVTSVLSGEVVPGVFSVFGPQEKSERAIGINNNNFGFIVDV